MPEESKECNRESLILLGNWGPFDDAYMCVLQVHYVARLRRMTHGRDLIPDRDVPSLTASCMNGRPIASHDHAPHVSTYLLAITRVFFL